MDRSVKQTTPTRGYHAPRRIAAAAETRQAILRAAKEEFEAYGWAGTTMRSIAMTAGVSPKTVEALFATKPALLEATLLAALGRDFSSTNGGGDAAVIPPGAVLELQCEASRAIEAAPDAATMLDLHAALVTENNVRAARICWAVETAVRSDAGLAALWERVTEAQRFGVHWSAEILLRKPGVRADLTLREAEDAFLTIGDWNSYRTLSEKGNMTPEEIQRWIARYYRRMLLA
jgi:AcrR family transcriptional regulator